HAVRALVRYQSVRRVPAGATPVIGDALNAASFAEALSPVDTIVHLVGTPHPNPAKASQFLAVDLASVRATVEAARISGVQRLVYVSVAQPAPIMHAYVEARREGERLIENSGLNASILRPWYVLGPGHWWPCVLVPVYAILNRIPAIRPSAQRLGLLTLRQMRDALVYAVEHPVDGVRIFDVPRIRALTIST
ncbi:MAG TPA: NAD(P)H-binding protein, partial [Rhodocyclaceae bacterium]|nr:NAD(P)H-binding protein [Rhodocyclaceae bacterium]